MNLLGLCLRKHVPIANSEWEKTLCSECGEECWMTPYAKEMRAVNGTILLCSICVSKQLQVCKHTSVQ